MAKGDKTRHQSMINQQQRVAQADQNALQQRMGQTGDMFSNYYRQGTDMNIGSYGDIMNRYKTLFDDPNAAFGGSGDVNAGTVPWSKVNPRMIDMHGKDSYYAPSIQAVGKSLGGYGQFADTGGYSPEDIQNIRARAIGPTRSVFASAQQGLDRQRALQGGYSPNYTAATAKLTRDLANQVQDANVAANASIARDIQQGKLAGLGGLAQTGLGQQGMFADVDRANQGVDLQAQLANQDAQIRAAMANQNAALQSGGTLGVPGGLQLAALQGMTSLFGANPGMAETFGNQILGNQQQMLGGNQNQQGLSNMLLNQQMQNAQIPSNFQNVMGNIGQGLALAGQIGGAIGTGGASLALPGGGLYGAGSIFNRKGATPPFSNVGVGNVVPPAFGSPGMPTGYQAAPSYTYQPPYGGISGGMFPAPRNPYQNLFG